MAGGAFIDGKRILLPKPVCLSGIVAQHANRRMDLDVEYERDQGTRLVGFRVVVLPSKEKSMTRLCTNLPRTPFSLNLVARLYRFRWQIELLFMEWKSYANLHKFDTANEHIAGRPHLGQPVCRGAQALPGPRRPTWRRQAHLNPPRSDVLRPHHRGLAAALLACVSIASIFRDAMAFLLANARRSTPVRDRKTRRLRTGLRVVGGCRQVITYDEGLGFVAATVSKAPEMMLGN